MIEILSYHYYFSEMFYLYLFSEQSIADMYFYLKIFSKQFILKKQFNHNPKEIQMIKSMFCAIFIFCCALVSAAEIEIIPAEFKSYKVNEEITFKVTAYESKDKLMKNGVFEFTVKDGNRILLKKVKADLSKANPFTIKVKAVRPGFIMAFAEPYKNREGKRCLWSGVNKYPAVGGVVVEPEKIRQAGTVPADFDQFWQDGLKAYTKAEVITEPAADIKLRGYKVFRVTVKHPDGSGAITGFLAIPEKAGKYPAAVSVPGAGPGVVTPYSFLPYTTPHIMLAMNVHPFPTAKTVDEQKALYAKLNKSCKTRTYSRENADDRNKYVYRKVWLAVSRAIDYVAKLPEFDGKHFISVGSSQGGGSALALGYLNRNITCVAAHVPALCDHLALLDKRQPGWPQLCVVLNNKKVANVAPYFDGATFASRIKVPTMISVGYVDTTCSPSSVYAAFNNLKGEKVIFPMYRHGHSISPDAGKAMQSFLSRQLKK